MNEQITLSDVRRPEDLTDNQVRRIVAQLGLGRSRDEASQDAA